MKSPVFVLQISNGLFKRAGFDKDAHILMCGSSIDFPEDDGAPKNFRAHDVIQRAAQRLP